MIKHDKSYLTGLDLLAIEKGYADLDLYMIKISREEYTEEQKEENRKIANSVSREQWGLHCEAARKNTASKIKPLLDALNNKFTIYQYEDREKIDYRSDWDLFFWCNGCTEGRDYSYVTLNFNEKRTLEQRKNDLERVLNYCNEIGFDGLDIAIQYTTKYNDQLVKNAVLEYAEKMKNIFIDYRGYKGKIKEVGKNYVGESVYGFYKKGSKTKYYKLGHLALLEMAIQ
jgi:hypothetical protein